MSGQIFQGNHLIAETNDAPLGFEQGGIEVTQAQYDQLVEDGNVAEDTNYYITNDDSEPSNENIVDWFNASTMNQNMFLGENGSENENGAWMVSDYIPVKNGDCVYSNSSNRRNSLAMCHVYNANKDWIGAVQDNSPTNGYSGKCVINFPTAAYIRVNVCKAWFGTDDKYNFIVVEYNRESRKGFEIVVDQSVRDSKNFVYDTFCKGMYLAYAMGDCTLRVKGGTYNMLTDWPTIFPSYFTALEYKGHWLGNNIKVIGENHPLLKWLNESADPWITDIMSIFHSAGSYRLENIDMEVENIRYCVHEDTPAFEANLSLAPAVYPTEYYAEYINCNMKHNGSSSQTYSAPCCIGAGTSPHGHTLISGGTYNSPGNEIPISYHNHGMQDSSGTPASSQTEYITVENIILPDNQCIQGYGFSETGSTIRFTITGCGFTIPPKVVGNAAKVNFGTMSDCQSLAGGYNQYENFTGHYYGGKPVYRRFVRELKTTEWTAVTGGYEASNLNLQDFSISNLGIVFRFEWNMYTNSDYAWSQMQSSPDSSIWLDARVLKDTSTGVGYVQVSGKSPYQYGGANGVTFQVYIEYTKSTD